MTPEHSFETLHTTHEGKVSDKWSSYLPAYDRLLSFYRNNNVRLLEIGVQNGGSLEIWAKYFPNATVIVGNDINPDCGKLEFADQRIKVIVGDANSDEAFRAIRAVSPSFDVILDDGSHLSSDIVKSFAAYFPLLAEDGVFIAEDLHCSYWGQFEGGLFAPYSAISFFKRLADIINMDHWGVEKTNVELLAGFSKVYGAEFSNELLAEIHSVEFVNSICVVRKKTTEKNRVGKRTFGGMDELVQDVGRDIAVLGSSQKDNFWSTLKASPDEAFESLQESLAESKEKQEHAEISIEAQRESLADRDAKIRSQAMQLLDLKNQNELALKQNELASKQLAFVEGEKDEIQSHSDHLEADLKSVLSSTSWHLARPIRAFGSHVQGTKRAFKRVAAVLRDVPKLPQLYSKYRRVGTSEGISGIDLRFDLLGDDEFRKQVSDARGYSQDLLRFLVKVGHARRSFHIWVHSNKTRSGIVGWIGAVWIGRTSAGRNLEKTHIRFHIDRPVLRAFRIVPKDFQISGWAFDQEHLSGAAVRVRIGGKILDQKTVQRVDVRNAFLPTYNLPTDLGFQCDVEIGYGFHRMVMEIQHPDKKWVSIQRGILLCVPHRQEKLYGTYDEWIKVETNVLRGQKRDIQRHFSIQSEWSKFLIVVDGRNVNENQAEELQRTLKSVKNQFYDSEFETLLLCEDEKILGRDPAPDIGRATNKTLPSHKCDYVIFLSPGQLLAEFALYEFASQAIQTSFPDLLYADHDHLTANNERTDPFFKPDWSPDYLETFNYVGFIACYRSDLAFECLSDLGPYDFVLQLSERAETVMHCEKILGHQMLSAQGDVSVTERTDILGLENHLERTGRNGIVTCNPIHRGCYEIKLERVKEPLVSIVIPTAGKTVQVGERKIDLIKNVVSQIREISSFKNLEIIVVDNDDLRADQIAHLDENKCERITYTQQKFNIAEKLNLGAAIATGANLILMNDDIEIVTEAWIERMLDQLEKPGVGVVGAKLLYPDQRIQHVGVVHNFGNPDHVHRFCDREYPGYFFSACGVRNYAAVTGACMMTKTDLYREVGGYSEELAVSFNDVDFCQKVVKAGGRIVMTPFAELIHMESVSRVPFADQNEVVWYQKKWAEELVVDKYYNERFLTVAPPTFEVAIGMRILDKYRDRPL